MRRVQPSLHPARARAERIRGFRRRIPRDGWITRSWRPATDVLSRIVRRRSALGTLLARNLDVMVPLFTAERDSEIAQSASQRAANLRQALRTENEQGDHQDEQQVCGLENVADHARELTAAAG